MNLLKLLGTMRAYAGGAPLGDVAVLKVDALAGVSPDVERKLETARGSEPSHDLRALRKLPPDTLGHAYARFCVANGISPLVVSPALRERFRDRPYPLRYAATHDLHHVLTGFDTSLAGEAGVLAFDVAQGTAPVGRAALSFVRVLYTLVAPWQASAIARNVREGLQMGERAQLVMAAPLEEWFDVPLREVRERLGLARRPGS